MQEFEIKNIGDKIVLYFGTEKNSINAYTLATSLICFADAARKANSVVNPGYDIEVIVESLSDGSFKAVLRAIYKSAGSLFSAEAVKNIILGVVASALYETAFHKDPQIIINTDEVIITDGDKKLVVPRIVYETTKELKDSDEFKKNVSEIIDTVKKDKSVKTFGITDDEKITPRLNLPVQDYSFEIVSSIPDTNERVIIETAQLEILRAILERSRRKWEFVWRGVKISGPVTDQDFYSKFFRHEIKIAPGDALIVKMKIFQKRNEDVGVFTNYKYEIYEVIRHDPKIKEPEMKL
jgi:hypothetical protein